MNQASLFFSGPIFVCQTWHWRSLALEWVPGKARLPGSIHASLSQAMKAITPEKILLFVMSFFLNSFLRSPDRLSVGLSLPGLRLLKCL